MTTTARPPSVSASLWRTDRNNASESRSAKSRGWIDPAGGGNSAGNSGEATTFIHAGAASDAVLARLRQNMESNRQIERIPIASREQWLEARKQDVTASVAGALLGVHEYQTPYGLWALKAGRVDEDPNETPAMQRGRLLEPVAIELIKEMFPTWHIVGGNDAYYRDPVHRLGGTPDLIVRCPERGLGIVQIKSVGSLTFRRKWQSEDQIEPPVWIGLQALVEADLVGAQWACVAAMVVDYGIDLHMVDVPLIPELVQKVRAKSLRFWQDLDAGIEPDPDFSQDTQTIDRMFGMLEPVILDLTHDNALPDIVDEINDARATARQAKEHADMLANEVKHKVIRAAETDGTVLGPDKPKPKIRIPGDREISWVSYTAKSYTVDAREVSYLRFPKPKKDQAA